MLSQINYDAGPFKGTKTVIVTSGGTFFTTRIYGLVALLAILGIVMLIAGGFAIKAMLNQKKK